MTRSLQTRKTRRFIAGTIVLTIAAFAVPWLRALDPLERGFSDYRHLHFGTLEPASEDVVMVDIDEYSLKLLGPHYGRWPWPRRLYREVLEFVSIGNPSGVFFDILFSEPMLGSDDDQQLASISEQLGNVSHAINLFAMEDRKAFPLPADFSDKHGLTWKGGAPFLGVPRFEDYALSLGGFHQQLPLVHVVSFHQDSDGVFRRGPLVFRYGETWLPSLGLAAAMHHLGTKTLEFGDSELVLSRPDGPPLRVPVDEQGRMRVNYTSRDRAPRVVSFGALVASALRLQKGEVEDPSDLAVNPLDFEGKLIVIGGSATGLKDLKVTPVHPAYPGALLQATVISNLLKGNHLWRLPALAQGALIWLLCMGVYCCVYFSSHILVRFGAPLVLLSLYVTASLLLLRSFDLEILTSVPILLALIAMADGLAFMGLVESKERRQLRSSLGKYLSPSVTVQLLSEGNDPRAEVGRTASVSILFMDIRNFTGISESLTPAQVVEGLNRYLSKMTDFIFEHHGTLDKFIGDAIMAFWGAPLPDESHELHAVECALAMQRFLTNEGITLDSAHGAIPCQVGVGINSGTAIVGNIGGERHLDYTVIGDNVNVASRLEGLTSLYRSPILVSESSYAKINRKILCRPLGEALVKGRVQGVRLYQPLGRQGADPGLEKLVEHFSEAVTRFEAKDLTGAKKAWEAAGVGPWREDPTIAFFIELCENGGNLNVLTRQKKVAA